MAVIDDILQKLTEANEIGRKLVALGTPKTCANCEYFDGGGQAKVRRAVKTGEPLAGDCLNPPEPAISDVE